MGLFGFGKNKKKDDIEKEVIKGENTNLSDKKVSIKVLGEGCEKCDKVNDNVKEAVEILNLDADIEKIEDLIEIVTYGVMSTPGIVINEKVVSVGKVLKTDEIVELLKKKKKIRGENMLKIAFICVHNSCRSQIAEALCRKYASDVFEPYSAGTELREINKDAIRLMKEIYNIDMEENQHSKLMKDIPEVDLMVSMGCGVSCPIIGRKFDEDLKLEDPTGKSKSENRMYVCAVYTFEFYRHKKHSHYSWRNKSDCWRMCDRGKNKKYQKVEHTFEPIYDENSKVLILGSFPSVKSREQNFYYGHPRNRFWRVISNLTETELPTTIEEKKEMLLKNNIAIWDVIKSCVIKGSSDSSIKNVVVNDITEVVKNSKIDRIFANGDKSFKLYKKYCSDVGIEIEKLPSTSPANAAFSIEKLVEDWEVIK